MKLTCIKPTKTLTLNKIYKCEPVKKGRGLSSYNMSYTGSWENCKLEECTSFRLKDDINITRRVSKKRFKKINN